MTKKTSFNNLSLQRQTYIKQQKHYHAIITFVRLFILAGFIALWEISAA
ncbi:MAG TPA: sulfonate ABC transporter permease, partial [Eubacterium sp.]|nr:sulfonate ABC transporter permease [Eubacterium sp.]